MKVQILLVKTGLGKGGAEKMLVDTLRHFDYDRFDVTVLTADPEGYYRSLLDPRCRVVEMRDIFHDFVLRNLFYRFPFLRRPLLSLNAKRARKALGNSRFQTAVSYLEGQSATLHHGILDLAGRNVTWVHADFLRNRWSLRYFADAEDEAHFYGQVDEVVFVSEAAREQFAKCLPLRVASRVLHNFFDAEEIAAKARAQHVEKRRPTLVSVGRLTPPKRFDRLVEAARLLRDRGLAVDVWVLGDGELKKDLEDLVRRSGLQDNVRFPGFTSNPYPYVQSADIFVSSSDSEGFPLAVGEAMCLGKPIVATAVTGTKEMLAGGAGCLVAPSAEAIADACQALLADEEAGKSLGQRAFLAARDRFLPDGYMRSFYEVLLP